MDISQKKLQQYVLVGDTLQPVSTSWNNVVLNTELTSTSTSTSTQEYKWSNNNTKVLIDFYSNYRKKVGTLEIKNIKMLWEKIAQEFKQHHNIEVSANNCLNRWKVLERNYKKHVDNKNKTGRARKFFEFEQEMDQFFGKKKNVHPELILSSETINYCLEENAVEEEGTPTKETVMDMEMEQDENNEAVSLKISSKSPSKPSPKLFGARIKSTLKKRTSTIEKLRADRKIYYDARLELERQKLEELRKRNKLIEESNEKKKQTA